MDAFVESNLMLQYAQTQPSLLRILSLNLM